MSLVQAKQQLEAKVQEVEKFHELTLGREKRVIELKEEVEQLKAEQAKVSK